MKTYTGTCHCGAVEYEADLDLENGPVLECNCSHCSIKGFLLAFVPETQFRLKSGEEHLTEYLFNKKSIRHFFCKVCGVQAFARGKDKEGNGTVAINIRTLRDVELGDLERMPFDGKNM